MTFKSEVSGLTIASPLNDPILAILLILFAIGVGIISSSLGIGGGLIVTPVLIGILGFEPAIATGTVFIMIFFTASSGTFAYSKKNLIQYRLGLILAISTILGAAIGSYVSSIIDPNLYKLIFGILLAPLAVKLIIFPKRKKALSQTSNNIQQINDENNDALHASFSENSNSTTTSATHTSTPPIIQKANEWSALLFNKQTLTALPLGLLTGFVAGLLGIGGGVLMVPILTILFGLEMHYAVATSAFIMIFTALSSIAIKVATKDILYDYAFFLSVGIIVGAQIGPRIATKIPGVTLQRIFGVFVIITLIRIICSAITCDLSFLLP